MDTDVRKICPNCFKMGDGNGRCGFCLFLRNVPENYRHQPLPAGTILLNRYIVGRVLGEGGFGITYKVLDLQSQTVLAMKEYAPLDAACRKEDRISMTAVTREKERSYRDGVNYFLEEATLLRSMGEIPAVVRIKDCFLENGTAYFIMEFLDGSTFKRVLKVAGNKLPFPIVTRIISIVGMALHTVHEKTKILHLDISPENIYILKDESVKLIDFGSAKRLQGGIKSVDCVFLKPHFAPPEQYHASAVKGSFSDVYATAATYYYALSGILIPKALDRQQKNEDYVRLKDMGLGIDSAVSDAVDRALMLEPAKRTQTMLEFVGAINPVINPVSRPVSKPEDRPAGNPIGKPDGNPVSRPAGNPVSKPEKQPVSNQGNNSLCKLSGKQEEKSSRRIPVMNGLMIKEPASSSALPYLKVNKGQNEGKKYLIKPGAVMKLGRLSECDLCFDRHAEISKLHCTIYYDGSLNQFIIQDLGSTNGTFLNGVRLGKNTVTKAEAGKLLVLSSNQCVIELGIDKTQ